MTVVHLPIDNLRSQVIRCPTNRVTPLRLMTELLSKSIVSNLDLHFIINEQISKFDVPVNYVH